MEEATPSAPAGRPRSEHIGARVTIGQKQIIKRAAELERQSVAAFILSRAEEAARQIVEARQDRTPGTFEVLCRIDAFADYVAEVAADGVKKAAELARDNHGDYKWEHRCTPQFDARLYVALDDDGNEIEETQVGDF